MSRLTRFFLIAPLVLVVAAVGAFAIAYRAGFIARSSVLEVATTGDLHDLFAPGQAPDSVLVDLALRKLESDYYKPIDPQTPISGESDFLAQPPRSQESQLGACRLKWPAGFQAKTGSVPPSFWRSLKIITPRTSGRTDARILPMQLCVGS